MEVGDQIALGSLSQDCPWSQLNGSCTVRPTLNWLEHVSLSAPCGSGLHCLKTLPWMWLKRELHFHSCLVVFYISFHELSTPPCSCQPIILLLLDITPMIPVLEGVVMELQDCALPLLRGKRLRWWRKYLQIRWLHISLFKVKVPDISCRRRCSPDVPSYTVKTPKLPQWGFYSLNNLISLKSTGKKIQLKGHLRINRKI